MLASTVLSKVGLALLSLLNICIVNYFADEECTGENFSVIDNG